MEVGWDIVAVGMGMGIEMPFSVKLQTETNEMTTRAKPNTKPIFILPKNTNIKPKFRKIVLNMPIKYQDNTKNFGQKYQTPIWYWHFLGLGIPNFWLPIGTPGP